MDFISGQVVPFLARLVLGLFLAGFAAGIGYLGAWVIVISFFEVTPGITDAMAIAGIGISAGAIGSLAWDRGALGTHPGSSRGGERGSDAGFLRRGPAKKIVAPGAVARPEPHSPVAALISARVPKAARPLRHCRA